jgi:molybdopterin-guanine dinucleotide biosynthesis protein A
LSGAGPQASAAGRLADVAGAVLAGGASQRMGRDKAHIPLAGIPLAVRVASCLEPLVGDLVLVGGDPPEEAPGRRVPDVDATRCALRGLVGALEATDTARVLVAATDLPFLTPDLLLGLLAFPEADAVLPRDADGPQPLCAVYRREPVLAVARQHLAAGRLALGALLDRVETAFVEGPALRALDPHGRALHNLNAPEDLEA